MKKKGAFDIAVTEVLRHEGGLSLDYHDPGNWTGGDVGRGELKGTNFGISAASYPRLDIRRLTREDAIAIYRHDRWLPMRGDEVPWPLPVAVLDAAVNQGLAGATLDLQQAVGVKADGRFGPITLAAVRAADPATLLEEFIARRAVRYALARNASRYALTWYRRLVDIHRTCLTVREEDHTR